MRILILGAGGTGGYFGGRLVDSGADVTFLVRPARAARLAADGLTVLSPMGDIRTPVKIITADTVTPVYDLVVLSCKAYDLDNAMVAIAPAMASQTTVMPLLNGLGHFERLQAAFGAERVIGGLCHIAVTMGGNGEIHHLNQVHALTFGEMAGGTSARIAVITDSFCRARFDARPSLDILQDAWEKFVFLTTLAGMTCLMRASVGTIMTTTEGEALAREMLAECRAIASASGRPPRSEAVDSALRFLTDRDSSLTASMLRDLEAGGRTEADHVLGDMLRRGRNLHLATPLLRIAACHLQAYEARRAGK